MKFRRLVALVTIVAAVGLLVTAQALAKEKKKGKDRGKASAVVATVNGEPVTKAEWSAIWKADQWHAPTLKAQPSFNERMAGRPYEDFFFREEIVKIRGMSQKYKDRLPQMKETIDAVWEKIGDGEDFASLAQQYSQDQGSAASGGDLGDPKEFHELVFPFNRIAFKMKEGEISKPFLTVFGYHIAKVDRVFPAVEGKGKTIAVRNILIRFPSTDPRGESEELADQATVEVLDEKLCKKLTSYCSDA